VKSLEIWKSWLACPRPLAVALGCLAALYLLHFGILCTWLGPFDYNHLSTYYELAWRFWTSSPGWPHFNPYFCGGRTLGGDPQIPLFSPIVAFVAFLGPVWTLKWEMCAQLAVGCAALWIWLTRWKVEEAGRCWAVLLFAGGGFVVARFMVGHVTLGFYFLIPAYFLLSYRLCDPHERHVLRAATWLCVLFAYCTLYKPNFLIYAVPPLVFEAAVRAALTRSARPLTVLAGAVLVGGLSNAVSLLPASDYFAAFPRLHDVGPKQVPLTAFWASLLLPLKAIPSAWYGPDFMQRHEYSIFLGPVALFFAGRGLGWMRGYRSEKLALLAFGLFSVWMGLGTSGQFSLLAPASWFADWWPGFDSIRAPVRFWFGAYLCLIVFSALGFRWPRGRNYQLFIVLVGIAPLIGHATINLSKVSWFSTASQGSFPRLYPEKIAQVHALPDEPYQAIRSGQGVMDCVENLDAWHSPDLVEGDLLQTSGNAEVKAKWLSWNRIEVQGVTKVATRVAFNFNHHPYWEFEGHQGRIVSKKGERLTLEVDQPFAGTLVYRQADVRAGALLSLIAMSFFSLVGLLFWRRSRGPWRIGLTGGIASGKSAAAQRMRENGWWVVDLDAESRTLTETHPEVRQQLRSLFGDAIFQSDGSLDRPLLREKVFADPLKRKALERMLHPRLWAIYEQKVREAARIGVHAVVCEAALIVETGMDKLFDKMVVVTAPLEVRRRRLLERDGSSNQTVNAILSAQGSDKDKIRQADFVLSNGEDIPSLERQVDAVMENIVGTQYPRTTKLSL
jgi:dephospho-CoA kinase